MELQKILLAVGNIELESYIEAKLSDEYLFVGKTVYREGIIKSINEKMPNIVVMRETLTGNENIMSIVYEIRTTFPNVRIIFLAGDREVGDELLSTLVSYGVYDIVYGKNIPAVKIISLIRRGNSYNDVKHFQPAPVLDERTNKMLFEAPDIDVPINIESNTDINIEIEDKKIYEPEEKTEEKRRPKITIPTIEIKPKTGKQKKEKETETNSNVVGSTSGIITFIGGKAGVGTTSIAINTAVELANMKKKTIFIEVNKESPSVAYWYELGLVSDGIETALEGIKSGDYKRVEDAIIKSSILKKSDGAMKSNYRKFPKDLDFMFFSKEVLSRYREDEGLIDSKDLYLHLLFQMGYDYVIIDVPSNIYNKNTVDAMMFSNKVFTVITEDVSSVGYHMFKLKTLDNQGIRISEKNNYIINKYVDSSFKKKDIMEWVNNQNTTDIPLAQEEFIEANFKGIPVILDNNNHIKDDIRKIVNLIMKKNA